MIYYYTYKNVECIMEEYEMNNDDKQKMKKAGKIVGSAALSATKGFLKWGINISKAQVGVSTGDAIGSDYYTREAGKSQNDFKNAVNKLKALKDIGNDNPIPEDKIETDAEFYAKNYDPALDDLSSQEAYNRYYRKDEDMPWSN